MPIAGLTEKRSLPRLGKIHLGVKKLSAKGAEYPAKTDYFVCPPEVQVVFDEQPKELRVLIPVEDENIFAGQYYKCYSRTRGLVCKGDGHTAMRMMDMQTGAIANRNTKQVTMREVTCAGRECEEYTAKPRACKEVMNFQFILPEVPGLGIWQIDTSSINSIRNINSAVTLMKQWYGRIRMLPLLLTLEPREVNNPEDGKKQTIYMLNLRTNGTMVDLMQKSLQAPSEIVSGLLGMPTVDDEIPEDVINDIPEEYPASSEPPRPPVEQAKPRDKKPTSYPSRAKADGSDLFEDTKPSPVAKPAPAVATPAVEPVRTSDEEFDALKPKPEPEPITVTPDGSMRKISNREGYPKTGATGERVRIIETQNIIEWTPSKDKDGWGYWRTVWDPITGWIKEYAPDGTKPVVAEAKFHFSIEWLKEQLAILQGKKLASWSNRSVVEMIDKLSGNPGTSASVTDAVGRLNQEQSSELVRKVKEAVLLS